jgi:hypothetical protein
MSTTLSTTATACALALTLAAGAPLAEARDFNRSGSYQTDKGRSGHYESRAQGSLREGRTRSQTVTTQSGKTYERRSTTVYDRDSGAFSRSSTGPRGASRSVSGTAEDGQFSGVYSGSRGAGGTFEGTRQRNEDGSVSRSGSYTNAAGGTGSFEAGRQRNEDGSRTRERSLTTADGDSYSRSTTGSFDREAGTGTLTRTVTGPDGESRTREVTVTPDR